ncbi:MAG: roadblock/LC7 domain-containing protein [Methanomicrobiaceae archaeon]|nr:roadblock/LC7 domain-containing protein [Methanomicrobiaceae archaeon]
MLKQTLHKFLNLEGVLAACVVGDEGSILAIAGQKYADFEELGLRVHQGMRASKALADELDQDELTMIFLEIEDGTLLATPLDNEHILAIIAKNNTNIGRIRYELKKNRDAITAAL